MNKEELKLFEEFLEFKRKQEEEQSSSPKKAKATQFKYSKRKDGRYCTNILLGHDPDTGKEIKKMIYGKTVAELKEKVAEARVELQRNTNFSKFNITVGAFRIGWFDRKKLTISKNTIKMYETIFNNYFGSIDYLKIRDVTLSDLQEIIDANRTKPRTCQKIRLVFNELFNACKADRIIYYNPADGLIIPKYQAQEKRALSEQEQYLITITPFDDREQALVTLLYYFGLRKEEALALTKSDFDFKQLKLRINKALIHDHNQAEIKETKNGLVRYLPIPNAAKDFLEYYISNLPTTNLFTKKTNDQLISATSYRHLWDGIMDKLKETALENDMFIEPGLSAYTFRHNYACMLMHANIDMKERQYLLGHKNIQMTLDVYTHIEANKLYAAEQLDKFLS